MKLEYVGGSNVSNYLRNSTVNFPLESILKHKKEQEEEKEKTMKGREQGDEGRVGDQEAYIV